MNISLISFFPRIVRLASTLFNVSFLPPRNSQNRKEVDIRAMAPLLLFRCYLFLTQRSVPSLSINLLFKIMLSLVVDADSSMRSIAVQYMGAMTANLIMRTHTQSFTHDRDYLESPQEEEEEVRTQWSLNNRRTNRLHREALATSRCSTSPSTTC